MKILTLVRHAKSSWKDLRLSDLERPLKKRGRRDALVMGERLAAHGACPDAVFASPALRALMTANLIAAQLGFPPADIQVCHRIYDGDDDELLDIIHGVDDRLDWVLLVGHNPEFTTLVNRLAPRKLEKLPTCGIVQISYAIDHWTQIGSVGPVHTCFDYPKKVKLE